MLSRRDNIKVCLENCWRWQRELMAASVRRRFEGRAGWCSRRCCCCCWNLGGCGCKVVVLQSVDVRCEHSSWRRNLVCKLAGAGRRLLLIVVIIINSMVILLLLGLLLLLLALMLIDRRRPLVLLGLRLVARVEPVGPISMIVRIRAQPKVHDFRFLLLANLLTV